MEASGAMVLGTQWHSPQDSQVGKGCLSPQGKVQIPGRKKSDPLVPTSDSFVL